MDMLDIMNAYRNKLSEDVWEQQVILKGKSQMTNTLESSSDGSLVEEDVDKAKHLQERLQVLEAQNSALVMENEAQREQYERCLDEVASHIVQALLTQKDLREECLILRTRVLDLEQQNWILSTLFQQGVRPASDLLLEKLQSKIMDLSCGDVFLSAERSKNFQLSRSLNSSQHESQVRQVAGFPMEKYPSQMSLAVPGGVYSYSSCSSSELSLSSACSECSSGSFTWKEGHSCNKLSSFTWKKRVSFGTSAPSDTHRLSEERLWSQKKEYHILAGLKMLQRYSQKKPSCLHSKSGYKDYMKSNEGIYSLGTNIRKKRTTKPFQIGKLSKLTGSKDQVLYDSDDADESSWDLSNQHNICAKDCCNHDVSNTFCRWKCDQNDIKNVDQLRSNPTNLLSTYNTKDFTKKLLRFSNVFESRKKDCDNLSSTVLHLKADSIRFQAKPQMSETDELEAEPQLDSSNGQHTEQLEWDLKKLSKVDEPLTSQSGWKNHSRFHSTESKERPFSLFNPFRMNACLKENTMSIIDAGNEKPIELNSQHIFQISEVQSIYNGEPNELPPLGSLNCEKGGNLRNHSILQIKGRPVELQTQNISCRTATGQNQCMGDSLKQLEIHVPEKQKPVRVRNTPDHKIQAVPPTHNCSKANIAKTHFQGEESIYKISNVTATEVSSSGGENIGFTTQKSPTSPPSKMSGFVSLASTICSQSPKVSQPNNNLPNKNDGGTCSSSSLCDVQHLDSPIGKNSESFAVSCSTKAVPLNLVYNPNNELQKSSSSQIPTNGKPKDATKKPYDAPSGLGCHCDTNELSFRGMKNKSAPHVSDNVSPQEHSKKKVQTFENGAALVDKTSSGYPTSMQDHFQYLALSQELMTKIPQPTSSCTDLNVDCQNSAENVSKTQIPLSLKGLVKLPLSLVKNPTTPLKYEKDHINTASKGKNALNGWDTKRRTQEKSKLGRRGGTRCNSMYGEQLFQVLPENNSTEDEIVDHKSLKSSLASGKLDLKPALGRKGAKPHSQSFSNHNPEKPSMSTSGGVGKVRKRIIMNMGENGNRQHLFVNSSQLASLSCPEEIPADCRRSLADAHKLTSSSSQSALPVSENRASNITKNEAHCPLTENEVHSFTFANKFGLKNSGRPMKVLPHSSSDTSPFPACQANEAMKNPLQSPIQMDLVKNKTKQVNSKVSPEKPGTSLSVSASTVEEKVMMGIEENMQKCQGQDKTQAPETKQKAALSLANWFGFRKSKLPAPSGKKTDPPKGKQQNTEAKTTSAVGLRQVKSDRKKDKKKNGTKHKDSQEVNISKASNKVDPVMGACNIHMGNASDQIQQQASRTGKDAFMKENFNRLPEVTQQTKNGSKLLSYKSESHGVPVTKQDIRKKMSRTQVHVKTQSDSIAKTVTQEINSITENEEQPTFKPTHEDHVIGSRCQMRTLDSGIGTFPKLEFNSGGEIAGSPETPVTPTLTSHPRYKIPSQDHWTP